jgi:hypothetical protein
VASFSLAVFALQAAQKYDIATIDSVLSKEEAAISVIKSGNEAGIIWADQANHKKIVIAFVHLLGFGASKREGELVIRKFFATYAANLD